MASQDVSARLQPVPVVTEGLVAGLLGGLAVILVFLIYDGFRGDALHTPSVLNALLFEGADAARSVESEVTRAVAYNAVHLLLWLGAGVVAAFLVNLVERHPLVWYLVFVLVSFAFGAFLWVEGALGVPGLGNYHLFAGALIGTLVMLAWLWWRHPGVLEHLDDVYQR